MSTGSDPEPTQVAGSMETESTIQRWVAIPPPLIFGVPLAVGLILQAAFPLRHPPRWLGLTLGALCILPAIVVLAAAHRAFRRARTSMRYTRRSQALIADGPFRFTRNPLFVGLVLLYAGVCFAAGAPWPLLFLPIVVALLQRVVIVPEERYLENRFGGEYRAYRAHVRRWL